MSDYTELKRLAQAALPRDDSPHLPCTVAFDRAASPDVVLALIAEVERLAALFECSQGDMRQAQKIMDRDMKDAERYRWIAENADVDCRGHEMGREYGSLDECVDAAIAKDAGQ
ncbi:hypothetical protein D3C76_758580 [compost metagenome]